MSAGKTLAVMALAAGVLVPALSATAEDKAPAGEAAPLLQSAPPPADTVIARVDGSEITYGDMAVAIDNLPAQYQQAPWTALYEPMLQQLVEQRLSAAAAEKAGIDKEPEVQRQLAIARERILHQVYLTRQIEPAITEEKLRQRYQAELKDSKAEEEVHARHILVKTRAAAEAVRAKLAKGADFAELAKSESTGPSGKQGGDLGFFKRGDMVPEFSDVAFSLKPGEVSQPVQTQFGWHVIKVEERRKAPPPSFAEREGALRNEAVQEVVVSTLKKLAAGAKITAYNPDGSERAMPEIGKR